MTVTTYTEIMRTNSKRPPTVIHAQDPRVQHSNDAGPFTLDLANLADGSLQLLVLHAIGGWAEVHWNEPTTTVGVQFWGDHNDGVARILIDDTEVWRGSTQGANVTFEQYITVDDLPNIAHTVRVEAIADPQLPSGGTDVAIAAFGWGAPGDEPAHQVFLPFVSN